MSVSYLLICYLVWDGRQWNVVAVSNVQTSLWETAAIMGILRVQESQPTHVDIAIYDPEEYEGFCTRNRFGVASMAPDPLLGPAKYLLMK